MKLRPLQDRVVLKRIEEEKKSAGGILIPDNAAEKPLRATVLAVGTGKRNADGTLIPVDLKVGDTVLIGKFAGSDIKIDGDEVVIVREEDILAVLTA